MPTKFSTKNITTLLLYYFITLLLVPQFASAYGQSTVLNGNNPLKIGTLGEWADKIPDYLTTVAGIVFLVVLLVGGIQYITSAGNEESSGKAKATLTWGVIGIVAIAIGKALIYWWAGIWK